MLIDRKARPWILICAAIFAAATYFFTRYWRETRGQPTGGSWPGLIFGAAGSAAMLVAMFLAVRKKTRSLYLGRPYSWMQAHVWFGLLSYPLILYHAGGFAWGGTLTQVLMWLFTAVFVSGIAGIILQQIIPTRLLRDVPAETIGAQINHVLQVLREEAEALAQPVRTGRERNRLEASASGKGAAVATMEKSTGDIDPFDAFYSEKIFPFLADRFDRESPLASAPSAQEAFSQWRSRLPESLHPTASRLESLCDERRQMARQRELNAWLHRWLLIHVPLSYGMVVLGVIHAIVAFKFTSPG